MPAGRPALDPELVRRNKALGKQRLKKLKTLTNSDNIKSWSCKKCFDTFLQEHNALSLGRPHAGTVIKQSKKSNVQLLQFCDGGCIDVITGSICKYQNFEIQTRTSRQNMERVDEFCKVLSNTATCLHCSVSPSGSKFCESCLELILSIFSLETIWLGIKAQTETTAMVQHKPLVDPALDWDESHVTVLPSSIQPLDSRVLRWKFPLEL